MIALDLIHEKVCLYYGVENNSIFNNGRRQPFVRIKQVFFYVARLLNNTDISYHSIARYALDNYGRKLSHCQVIFSCNAIKDQQEIYPRLKQDIENILELIEQENVTINE